MEPWKVNLFTWSSVTSFITTCVDLVFYTLSCTKVKNNAYPLLLPYFWKWVASAYTCTLKGHFLLPFYGDK